MITKVFTNIKKYFKDIIYLIIIVFIIILVRDNFKNMIITSLGGFTHKEVTTKIDSVYKLGKIDTLKVFNHYVKTKGIILNPEPVIKYRWRYKNPDTKEEVEIDSIKKFNIKIKDSLIDGNFKIINSFTGNLLFSDFKYKPLYPKLIRRVDTVEINTTTTNTLSSKTNKFGIGIGINSLQSPSLLGSFTTKDNWQFIYEYHKNFNNNIIINNSNIKDYHSIKLIKNF